MRSSVARRLGVGKQDGPNAPRHVEGLLDIMDDAVTRCGFTLTHERLHAWQAALVRVHGAFRPGAPTPYRLFSMGFKWTLQAVDLIVILCPCRVLKHRLI